MKKIVTGEELKKKTLEAIDLLCDTVKTTLGPKGCNTIIDHSAFSPFITNDGVTIAKNIESEDEVVNTILELAKEASIKTNENVGDGTTTTLVLLQGIYKDGLKLIEEGINPILIKKELNKALQDIIIKIQNNSKLPNKKDLERIASISASSPDIGKIISDAFNKVKNKNAIKISESNCNDDRVVYKKGYILDTSLVSLYYFQDKDEIKIKNAYVILVSGIVDNLEIFSNAINDVVLNNQSLIIVADDFSDEVVNQVLALYLNDESNIYLCKIPGYGMEKKDILYDLSSITKAHIFDNSKLFDLNNIGIIDEIYLNKNEINFVFKNNDNINERVQLLENLDSNNIINKESLDKRIAMLKYGIIEIFVGAYTDAERREKKMRFDDSLESISSASNGIVPGCGLVFYKISEEITDLTIGYKILKKVLKLPFEQIMKNAGIDFLEIIEKIKNNHFNKIYNVEKEVFEDLNNTNVVDSLDVVINSIVNAVSIAGMLLTTSSIVINEYQNNVQKINDYTEL